MGCDPFNKEVGMAVFAREEFAIEGPVNVACKGPLMCANDVGLHWNVKDEMAHLRCKVMGDWS